MPPEPAVDSRLRVNPLGVKCPFCDAKPWHRCRSVGVPFAKEKLIPHTARYDLAAKQRNWRVAKLERELREQRLSEEEGRAETERDALKRALKFYADGSNYMFAAVDGTGDEWSSPVHEDEGEIARAALAASVSKGGAQ